MNLLKTFLPLVVVVGMPRLLMRVVPGQWWLMFAAGAFTAIATYAILVVLPSEDRQPRRSMEAREAGRVLWSMAGLLALCEAGLIWTVFIASDLDRLPPVMASSMAFLGGAVLGCVGLLAFLAQTSADRERRKRSS